MQSGPGTLADALGHQWPLASALAFLAWYVFAPQCLSTSQWCAARPIVALAMRDFAYMIARAYIAAFGGFHIASAVGGNPTTELQTGANFCVSRSFERRLERYAWDLDAVRSPSGRLAFISVRHPTRQRRTVVAGEPKP